MGGSENRGYLGGDSCQSYTDQATCTKDTTHGCAWIDPKCPAGASCPSGVCYQPDPCLTLDKTKCLTNKNCAWSESAKLCPLGADCGEGGYCHPLDANGGPCGCVTPLACPAGEKCPPPECDCSGGGSGGGGSCTCACPACAPGEACPPCDCKCDPNGGCVDNGTCTCACPDCKPGETCPPCACGCGTAGPVPAPDGTTAGTPNAGGGIDPATGAGGTPGSDPCSKFTDQATCSGVSSLKCQWYALGAPCVNGQPCQSGVCQSAVPQGCGCACPTCAPGQSCPPCQCNCTDPSGGCVPPNPPPPPTGGTGGSGTACPAIGCAIQCPMGYLKDASGCIVCKCA